MRRVRAISLAVLCCLAELGVASASYGQQPSARAGTDSEVAWGSEQIAQAVAGLNANRFVDRQRASERLASAGAEAIPALEDVALGDSREAGARAVQILKQHFESDVVEAAQPAESALKRIAESGRPAVAQLARRALRPLAGQAAVRALRISDGELRMEIKSIGESGRLQIDHESGVREMEAQISGRRTRVVESRLGEITVQFFDGPSAATQPNGKEDSRDAASESIAVRDLSELEKLYPAVARAYQQSRQALERR